MTQKLPIGYVGDLARTDDKPMSFVVCAACGAMIPVINGQEFIEAHAQFHQRVEPEE